MKPQQPQQPQPSSPHTQASFSDVLGRIAGIPKGVAWRAVPLDKSLLLFDRLSGTNVLLTGEETAHLRRIAPRNMQVGLTNACNKTCSFCYRPLDAKSQWTFDELVDLARFCDEWGVLELAFGGGEPTVFPRFAELLRTIWTETSICPNFTTNGLRLTRDMLREIAGSYGQLQLSVYDEDDTNGIIDLLVSENARFGLNYLVTPQRVRSLEADVFAFLDRGVKDMLFLSYKGTDASLHLSPRECRMFDESVAKLHEMFSRPPHGVTFKVDVCWASRLVKTPQLLNESDCQANIDFLSLTSDKRVLSCSFVSDQGRHPNEGFPFTNVREIKTIWESCRDQRIAAQSPGCARLPNFGFLVPDGSNEKSDGKTKRTALPVLA